MRDNVRTFARFSAEVFDVPQPVVEIGSRAAAGQEDYADVRSVFKGKAFIGSDYMVGPGVDLVMDGHNMGIKDRALGSIVTFDTLEHVQDPLLLMREVHRTLNDGGLAIVAVPMMFPIHNHPWDYWRFTPAALDLLLQEFDMRAVIYQGDPDAPHTVFGVAVKDAPPEQHVAFDAKITELITIWPTDVPGGPLILFEPLRESLTYDADPNAELQALSVTAGQCVVQEFVCDLDNLTRIDLKFACETSTGLSVSYQVEDIAAGVIVAQGIIYGVHLLDKAWTPLTFADVINSSGKRYRLTLEVGGGAQRDVLRPIVGSGPIPAGTSLSKDGKRIVDSALCFRALCRVANYEPANYDDIARSAPGELLLSRADLMRQVTQTRSDQLWYVAARIDKRLDGLSERVRSVEKQLDDILLFVKNVQSSAPFSVLRRAGRLFRSDD